MRSSRFIQPRRVESMTAGIQGDIILDDPGNEHRINTSSDSSPDCVVSSTSKENIADILCNLEQMYDSSFSKWDNIRKIDELEHAAMRGIPIFPTDNTTISELQPAQETKVVAIVASVSTNVNIDFKSEGEQSPPMTRGSPPFDFRAFVKLMLLLLFLLRASYTQRRSR